MKLAFLEKFQKTPNFIIKFLANLGKFREVFNEKSQSKEKCLAACTTQTYSPLVTSSKYPTKATFKYTKEFCFVVMKLLSSCETRGVTISKKLPTLCELIGKLKVKVSHT